MHPYVIQLADYATNSNTYGLHSNFGFAFFGAQTWTTFVPGGLNTTTGVATPNFESDLPFFSGTKRAMNGANAAIVGMRYKVCEHGI